MLKPKKQLKFAEILREHEVPKSIFVIPNPFDDYLREKKGWFSEIQKLEMQVKHMRKRVSELNTRQGNLKQQLQYIKAYCATLPHGRKR